MMAEVITIACGFKLEPGWLEVTSPRTDRTVRVYIDYCNRMVLMKARHAQMRSQKTIELTVDELYKFRDCYNCQCANMRLPWMKPI